MRSVGRLINRRFTVITGRVRFRRRYARPAKRRRRAAARTGPGRQPSGGRPAALPYVRPDGRAFCNAGGRPSRGRHRPALSPTRPPRHRRRRARGTKLTLGPAATSWARRPLRCASAVRVRPTRRFATLPPQKPVHNGTPFRVARPTRRRNFSNNITLLIVKKKNNKNSISHSVRSYSPVYRRPFIYSAVSPVLRVYVPETCVKYSENPRIVVRRRSVSRRGNHSFSFRFQMRISQIKTTIKSI